VYRTLLRQAIPDYRKRETCFHSRSHARKQIARPRYHPCMEAFSAFVLAGGKSSRMGAEKAFLELAGKPLIERALTLAGTITADVKIVGDRAQFASYGEVIEDVYHDCGPLAGIHAALKATASTSNLILGVDLPFLTPAFLEFLIAEARASNPTVTVPYAGAKFHSLCAVYRKDFYAHAERALSQGKNRIDALFREIPARAIREDELASRGFTAAIFRNLNTPTDFEQANRELTRLDL